MELPFKVYTVDFLKELRGHVGSLEPTVESTGYLIILAFGIGLSRMLGVSLVGPDLDRPSLWEKNLCW